MGSVNKWIGIGNLGKDPEVRHTQTGTAVANFPIACDEKWIDKKTGEKHENVEWVNIVAWAAQAESAGKYLTKGKQVYVEGRLQTRKWKDREGRDRWTTEVMAQKIVYLGSGAETQPSAQPSAQLAPTVAPAARPAPTREPGCDDGPPPIGDDDVAF